MRNFAKTTALLLIVALSACSSENSDQSSEKNARPADPTTQTETQTEVSSDMSETQFIEENKAFLEANKTKDGVTETASGLQYKILTEGTGEKPAATDLVTFHYSGRLIDGTEFDSSYTRGEPLLYPANRLIPGWTEALVMMPVGSKWELTIPSDLAYGDQGAGNGLIPGGATLVFEVELLSAQTEEEYIDGMRVPQAMYLEENAKQDGVQVTDSGLQYRVIEKAEGGKSPDASSQVTVHYAGKLIDGSEFDSSYKRGEPASFPLNGVIAGWTEGLQLMSEGDKYEFFIPYTLGYGERGSRSIPPFATLIFTVELISVDS